MKSHGRQSRVNRIHSEKSWNSFTTQGSCPVVVHFTAAWCMPSVAMNPLFEELALSYKDIHFLLVDVDEVKVTISTTSPSPMRISPSTLPDSIGPPSTLMDLLLSVLLVRKLMPHLGILMALRKLAQRKGLELNHAVELAPRRVGRSCVGIGLMTSLWSWALFWNLEGLLRQIRLLF
ncbi:hypothetical protein LWI28_014032 [Acer negundo]|uniref:Thioredoxin domain-containing protein n=1 Tax=Acer negundo TaxID=4023 RepID=A0AAD5J5D0_ACENE|nr:hypothetical protein LWI28_014032 [Acer negundo]